MARAGVELSRLPPTLSELNDSLKSLPDPLERVKRVIQIGQDASGLQTSEMVDENRVLGCTAKVRRVLPSWSLH